MSLSAALAEARAAAPSGVVILDALAFYNSSFVNKQGATSPLFVMNNNEDLRAALEPAAPQFGGQYVDWLGIGFRATKPELTAKGVPVFEFEIDNINDEFAEQIERAQDQVPREPIYCVHREYLSTNLTAPQYVSPYRQCITTLDVSCSSIVCRAQVTDSSNTRFLRRMYGLKQFGGLIK